jgi:hypothetical protein
MKPTHYNAPAYACIIPLAMEVIRPLGYACAVHGSMANDLDLVAVPWVEDCATPHEVYLALHEAFKWCTAPGELLGGAEVKPHGRLAFNIALRGGLRIDLSVMPRCLATVPPVPLHIHSHGDGRGDRKVFLDGVELSYVVFADTQLGIVDAYFPLGFEGRSVMERRTGLVEVKSLCGAKQTHIDGSVTYL